MDTAEQNAIRATARQCWGEIQEAWKAEKARNAKQRDIINRRILLSYEKRINPRFTFYQLIYHIGVINGALKERL
jgi:hypothetical protein